MAAGAFMSNPSEVAEAIAPPPIPRSLLSGNPLAWLRVFGTGAVIASLTIGTGEPIFSSCGGVIFGHADMLLTASKAYSRCAVKRTNCLHLEKAEVSTPDNLTAMHINS